MKVLVCGGRNFSNGTLLDSVLTEINKENCITVIIHGGATGADSMADHWASVNGICTQRYPANWQKHGKAAGPIRNKHMLEFSKPDIVVAFEGGRGTANMVSLSRKAGVPVKIVY